MVITSAARTAVGRLGGALRDIPAEKLAAIVIAEALRRSRLVAADGVNVKADRVDEVVLGSVLQSSEAPNIARVASLLAGLPVEVPAYTVHRQCGSGLQAVAESMMAIRCGTGDVYVAGGTESMSTAPYYITGGRYGYRLGHGAIYDPFVRNSERSAPEERFGRWNMGLTAENLASKYGISRAEQDEFAAWSQEKAGRALSAGVFSEEIVPIPLPGKKSGPRQSQTEDQVQAFFAVDEQPRPGTTAESLAALPPAFKPNGTVTAGNSCGLNDGAAAVVVMSGRRADELGLEPLAEVLSVAVAGVDPREMGIGPVPAARKALALAGVSFAELAFIELNEAFAAQALSVQREWGDPGGVRLNVNGGAIALGHPVGATGAKLLTTLIYSLRRRGGGLGLATLCIGGGQGIAAIVRA